MPLAKAGGIRSTAHYKAIAEYMKSEAQRKAENAYRKKNVKQLVLRFYPNAEDEAMYEWLKSQNNVTEYLKTLVAQDMENPR